MEDLKHNVRTIVTTITPSDVYAWEVKVIIRNNLRKVQNSTLTRSPKLNRGPPGANDLSIFIFPEFFMFSALDFVVLKKKDVFDMGLWFRAIIIGPASKWQKQSQGTTKNQNGELLC